MENIEKIKYPVGKFPRSLETRRKTSESAKNRVYTEEGRRKRRESLAKRKCPPALGKTWKVKEEFRLKRIGRKGYFTGYRHAEESKLKISENRKGISAWNLGKKMPPEYSDTARLNGAKGILAQQTSKGPTSIELKVGQFLLSNGILGFNWQYLVNEKFLVDFYIPSYNLIIEADGDYWHGLPIVQGRDKAKNAYLIKCGYNLVRVTETEINNGTFKEKIYPFLQEF